MEDFDFYDLLYIKEYELYDRGYRLNWMKTKYIVRSISNNIDILLTLC